MSQAENHHKKLFDSGELFSPDQKETILRAKKIALKEGICKIIDEAKTEKEFNKLIVRLINKK